MQTRKFLMGKFQLKIIAIAVIPMFILIVFTFLFLSTLYSTLFKIIQSQSSIPVLMQNIQKSYNIAIFLIVAVFIGILFWIYSESSKMVGAFERLIKELDQFDPEKKKRAVVYEEERYLRKGNRQSHQYCIGRLD